jgi:N-acetylglucosamine transport system substrate-binding protein
MKISKFLAVMLVLTTLFSMAACGNNAGNNGTPTPTNPEDVAYNELGEAQLLGTFELQIFEGGYGSAAWEYAIAEFQKLHPDLEIIAHLDSNVNAQMKTRWAKNNPPDFVFLEGTNIPTETWMRENKLRDLKPLFETGTVYGTDTLIKDQLKDGLTFEFENTGKIFQLPIMLSTYGVWYDETLMNQKGWKVPTNYTELQSFCSTAKGAGIDPMIYTGQYSGYAVWGFLMPAVAAAAVESNDLDFFYDVCTASRSDVWSDPRFKDALQKFADLANAGYFDMAGLSMNHINSQVSWLNHEAVLIPNGLWLETEMKDSTPDGFKMRYYPSIMQDADQPTCIIASATGMGIAENAKNPAAAEAFIRFLYTDEISRVFAEKCAVPVATKTDMTSANLTETAKQVNEMINSDDVTLVAKAGTSWGSVDGTVNDVINKIVSKDYTVDQAIDALKKATDKKNS